MPSGNISPDFQQLWPASSAFWSLPLYWEKVIAICYVDDLIFWARNEKDIVELAFQLHAQGVNLEQEDDAAEFLEVHIESNPETNTYYDA